MAAEEVVTNQTFEKVLAHPLFKYALERGFLQDGDPLPTREVFKGTVSLCGRDYDLSRIHAERLWTLFLECRFLPCKSDAAGNLVQMSQDELNSVTSRPRVVYSDAISRQRYTIAIFRRDGAVPTSSEIDAWVRSYPLLLAQVSRAFKVIRGSVMKWFDPVTRYRAPDYDEKNLFWKSRIRAIRLKHEASLNATRALNKEYQALLAERDTDMRQSDPNWKGTAGTVASIRAPDYEEKVMFWKDRIQAIRLKHEASLNATRALNKEYQALLAERDTDMRQSDPNWKGKAGKVPSIMKIKD